MTVELCIIIYLEIHRGQIFKKLLGINFIDFLLYLMENDHVSLFVKDIISVVKGTHKIHDN